MCALSASPSLLSAPYSQNVALPVVDRLEGGILLAWWLVRDYLQGPGVSAARRPLLAPLLGLELVRAHLGAPLNIHPCHPGKAALAKNVFEFSVLTLVTAQSGLTNGPD